MQIYILATLSFLGLLVSAKLWREHGMRRPMFCPKEFRGGCDVVKHSRYAWFAGMSTAMLGSLYYLVFLVVLALPYILPLGQTLSILSYPETVMLFLILYPLFGFIFSLRLLSVQILKLKALCFWCLLQSLIATGMFFYSYSILFN
ncbi:hypothetical protein A3J61_00185 [Candidatus Nomurabacteria bacterium RIFCSPHIGHO2_02_FULL_38_15]|uniref:Vitamin K epoxide reductase domain-containing protein n=1 Tax=Candidatus Nomurabacteria bacterium RIFCSPHIGHO2_02_FULL_38_15 TaxID=1801752 RepID=A0A1F6VT05_9BACT|nr:MAG: hypothetical protein A3J61_00185 [Candidatus Nomurabacteria bacterium RIFCSPHIGHO2_02_FULL_38_15]